MPDPTHVRLRKFNTKETYPEQDLDNDLCQAVVANGVVYLRGQIGQNLETRESVGIGDVVAQTEQAMSNIKMLLEEAGSRLEDDRQSHGVHNRPALPRGCLSHDGQMAEGRFPCVDWHRGAGTRASGMARRD